MNIFVLGNLLMLAGIIVVSVLLYNEMNHRYTMRKMLSDSRLDRARGL